MDAQVTHQARPGGGLFCIEEGGKRVAEMTYRRLGESHILIDHTFVDPALRGRGVARQLLDAAVAWARASRTRVSASCSYVVTQFARDPSLRDVQA
ncbi:MAG: GNAT family N-acetyltransferase [Pseudomonadota bacterium]|jgi:predicted GNAT family acetyltransferase|nr:MAG: GNAT family N-acetyltransferase [Pseudomonadota bacterium]